MKHIKELAQMAIDIKDVESCNPGYTFVGRESRDKHGACLIGTLYDIDKLQHNNRELQWATSFATYFGVTDREAFACLSAYQAPAVKDAINNDCVTSYPHAEITGQDYYDAIVILLDQYGKLETLRKLEREQA